MSPFRLALAHHPRSALRSLPPSQRLHLRLVQNPGRDYPSQSLSRCRRLEYLASNRACKWCRYSAHPLRATRCHCRSSHSPHCRHCHQRSHSASPYCLMSPFRLALAHHPRSALRSLPPSQRLHLRLVQNPGRDYPSQSLSRCRRLEYLASNRACKWCRYSACPLRATRRHCKSPRQRLCRHCHQRSHSGSPYCLRSPFRLALAHHPRSALRSQPPSQWLQSR